MNDSSYYKVCDRTNTYKTWLTSHKTWWKTEKFKYDEPKNHIYYDGEIILISEICDYYKEKIIFDKL
jgi:hypothetical protein